MAVCLLVCRKKYDYEPFYLFTGIRPIKEKSSRFCVPALYATANRYSNLGRSFLYLLPPLQVSLSLLTIRTPNRKIT